MKRLVSLCLIVLFSNSLVALGYNGVSIATFNKVNKIAGLLYFCARYYNADAGRFLSPDPHTLHPGGINLSNPQSINPYVYCMNDPLTYVDPNGLYTEIVVTNVNRTGTQYGWTMNIYKNGTNIGSYNVSRLSTENPSPRGDMYGTNAEAPPGTYHVSLHPRNERPVLGDEPGGHIITSPEGTDREWIEIHSGTKSEGCILTQPGTSDYSEVKSNIAGDLADPKEEVKATIVDRHSKINAFKQKAGVTWRRGLNFYRKEQERKLEDFKEQWDLH